MLTAHQVLAVAAVAVSALAAAWGAAAYLRRRLAWFAAATLVAGALAVRAYMTAS